MKYDRTERISEEIKKALSSIIMYELKDPGITGMISVTSVNTTRDLSYSKVYVSVFGSEEQKKSSFNALKSSMKFIRRSLSTKVKLRHTPELLFELDSSIEYGAHMNEVFNKISVKKDEVPNAESSEAEDLNDD
jgi:ribosome-binding factor A